MADDRRDKGEGSIFQRADGLWVGRFVPYTNAKRVTLYGKTENEVKKKLRDLKKDVIKNRYTEVKKITVQEYMDRWLYNIKITEVKPKSFDLIEGTLKNQIYPFIGDIQIGSLNADDIQIKVIKAAVDKNLSYSTIKKAYNALNNCFKLGIVKGDVIKNPCVGVVLPKILEKEDSDIKFFEQEQMDLICEKSVETYSNGKMIYRLGYSIILLMYSGLRIGELLALKWTDINFEKKTIHVVKNVVKIKNRNKDAQTKNILRYQDSTKTDRSSRTVFITTHAIDALTKLKEINGNRKYVMNTENDSIVSLRNVDRMFRNILDRCGFEEWGVHTLRHTYASWLFRNHVDVKTVSEQLGHKDVSFTYNTYIHLIEEQKQETIAQLDKL